MPQGNKTKNGREGNGPLYFLLLLACLSVVIFLAYKTFAGEFILGAKIDKIEEVGESEQVTISFNRPVVSMSLDNIEIDPFVGFSYELSEDMRRLTIIPSGKFALEQKYTITLRNVRAASGFPIVSAQLAFYTERMKKQGAPAEEETSGEAYAELTLARDRYVPPATSAVPQPVEIASHFPDGKYIDVSIGKQVMTLFEDGRQVNQFLVSTGQVGMPTPTGEFKVLSKETNHWSGKYKLWMPYSMNFASGGYYIHELPYWPNGYREGESHLGHRVSHGCVRLGIGPAQYVFDWSEIGTPVYIHN